MQPYPDFAQFEGSVDTWIDDLQIDTAVNGATRARGFFTTRKREFTLKHRIDAVQRNTLATFYDANRFEAITLIWHGAITPYDDPDLGVIGGYTLQGYFVDDEPTFDCIFAEPPKFEFIGAGWTDVTVKLREV